MTTTKELKGKDWKKLVLKRIKENLGSAWRKGYHNEEGLDEEEEDILGMVEYARSSLLKDIERIIGLSLTP